MLCIYFLKTLNRSYLFPSHPLALDNLEEQIDKLVYQLVSSSGSHAPPLTYDTNLDESSGFGQGKLKFIFCRWFIQLTFFQLFKGTERYVTQLVCANIRGVLKGILLTEFLPNSNCFKKLTVILKCWLRSISFSSKRANLLLTPENWTDNLKWIIFFQTNFAFSSRKSRSTCMGFQGG